MLMYNLAVVRCQCAQVPVLIFVVNVKFDWGRKEEKFNIFAVILSNHYQRLPKTIGEDGCRQKGMFAHNLSNGGSPLQIATANKLWTGW